MSRRARQRALARPWALGEAPEPHDEDENDFDLEQEFGHLEVELPQQQHNETEHA